MKTLKDYKDEQMKNPEFAKEYTAIQPEMDVIRVIVNAGKEGEIYYEQIKRTSKICGCRIE